MFTYSLSGLEIKATPDGPEEVEENETTARSATYQVLGAFFSPPDRDHYEKAREGLWAKELAASSALLPYSFEIGGVRLGEDITPEGYETEWARVFGQALAEASHRDEESHEIAAQLRREYDYFGLGVNDAARSPGDLSTECDFMQYLCFREAATASPRLRTSYRRAQRDFLERHMLSWVPSLVASVSAQQPGEVFGWGLERLDHFLQADHHYVTTVALGS